MSRLAVALFLLSSCASVLPPILRAQDEPSLAERAEALRKKAQSEASPTASPTPLAAATATPAKTVPALVATPKPTVYLRPSPGGTPTPQAAESSSSSIGNKLSCKDYRNDELGLEIKCLDNWTVADPDKLTTNTAIPIGKFRVQNGAEIAREPKNVYAMRDTSGSAVVLTLVQFQPDDPLPINLRSDIQHAIAAEDPGMRLSQETIPLDVGNHHFAAFRAVDLRGARFESVQAMVFRGYLIQISVGSTSQDRLATILKDLRAHITWGGASPQ